MSYQINPRHTLRWAVSRATRSPTFYEEKGNSALFAPDGMLVDQDIVPSSGLDSEVNTSMELGYLGQWPEWGGQLDVRLYRDHVTDYIGQQKASSSPVKRVLGSDSFSDKFFQYTNGGSLDVTGLDAQLVWKPQRDFSLHLAQAFARVKASQGALEVDDDLPDAAPEWTSSLLASWRFAPGWSTSAMVYHSEPMKWLSEGDPTESYTRTDLRLEHTFKQAGVNVEWAFGVQNLGDDYTEFRRQNVFTQRAYTTLCFDW